VGGGGTVRPHDCELGAAATDVHDEQLLLDPPTERHAEQVEPGFLLVRQHVERRAGRSLDLAHDPRRIGRQPERFRAEEGRGARARPGGDCGVAGERLGQPRAAVPAEWCPVMERRPEADERGLVMEDVHAVRDDLGDDQVDGVRAKVDAGPDPARGFGGSPRG
jgi:hypothetical protein